MPQLVFISNPEGYEEPVGPATDELELGVVFGRAETASLLLSASKTIAKDAMEAMVDGQNSHDITTPLRSTVEGGNATMGPCQRPLVI